MRTKSDVKKILAILDREYPDARCSLNFSHPLELLVATILSAQCTDDRVNQVTADLFRKYKSAQDYAQASLPQLEEAIRSTGFFRNKAKSIQSLGRELLARHEGQVPADLAELVKLPGVGRKTANVVLGTAFDIPGVVVDTHAGRIARRLGLTDEQDPVKVEFQLMDQIPRNRWTKLSHQLIAHGRKICNARKPKCSICPLLQLCPFGKAET